MKSIIGPSDIASLNDELAGQPPQEIILWAYQTFGQGLVMASKFGPGSAAFLHLVTGIIPRIRVIFLDTTAHYRATLGFAETLTERLNLDRRTYRPRMDRKGILAKYRRRIWRGNDDDKRLYGQITKVEPMARAWREERATAILYGIHADQGTAFRATAPILQMNESGVCEIHPVIEAWTDASVSAYLRDNGLPDHPFARTHGSVGDRGMTRPGKGRSGRLLCTNGECGLHGPAPSAVAA